MEKDNTTTLTVIGPDGKESKPITLQRLEEITATLNFTKPELKGINILKVKIVDSCRLDIEYEELTTVGTDKIVRNGFALIHSDLVNAFEKLSLHLAVLCEYIDDDLPFSSIMEVDTKQLSTFYVTGFSKGGHDEFEGLVLIGQKKLRSGRVVNLVTPFTMWEAIEGNPQYRYTEELFEAYKLCVKEVENYLNGKCASEQLELDVKN